jgi:hypothetical protein
LIRPDVVDGPTLRELVRDWEKSVTVEVVAALVASIGHTKEGAR